LNELLDDITAQLTAEADLMSEYIDTKDLGADFVGVQPVDDPAVLTVDDGQKVAVALLRGPMAASTYATQYADYEPNLLAASSKLFASGCQSKWSVMADNRLRVRSMAKFLKDQGQSAEYKAWVPAAAKRRAEELEAEEAQKRAALAAEQQQKAKEQREMRQQQIEKQQQASREMQQALALERQAQAQAQAQAQSQSQPTHPSGYVVDDDYAGWYYGGGAWYRNGAYLGAAAARTDARYAGWRGQAGRGGGGGRGRGRR
jgi:hypothetical protein